MSRMPTTCPLVTSSVKSYEPPVRTLVFPKSSDVSYVASSLGADTPKLTVSVVSGSYIVPSSLTIATSSEYSASLCDTRNVS